MTGVASPLSLGLTGYPLGHSLSPRLHAAALGAAGLPGEYRLYPAEPLPQGEPALRALLGRLRAGELHGLNVTIPHKSAVLPWLDELAPVARAVGAANTLYLRAGRLAGDNTDVGGFLADLAALWPPVAAEAGPLTALVLGAGGSARAVVYALAQTGWQVFVAARRPEQAQALAAALIPTLPDDRKDRQGQASTAPAIQPLPLAAAAFARLPTSPALIVNTTSLGMASQPADSPWPGELPFPEEARVYDLVYNPAETPLLRAARLAGRPGRNGLGMLVEQAALAFERWTGRPADRAAMFAAAKTVETG